MKTSELRQLNTEALRARADTLFSEITALEFSGVHREKNVKKRRVLRKERARTLTLLLEREREGRRS